MPRTKLITQATRLVTEVTRENWNNSRCVTLLVFFDLFTTSDSRSGNDND